MLDVINLTCVRGDNQLFNDLSFSLKPGTLLYVHGPNGSGKTTLLRTLCGLTLEEKGEIHWENENVKSLGEDYLRHVSYFGHLNGLKDELTGLENVRFSIKMAGLDIGDDAISDVFHRLGVEVCQDLPTKVLSQGQKKRTALARFLLLKTKLWILDEPFTALDVKAVVLLQNILTEHVAEGGMIVLTTHQEVEFEGIKVDHLHLGG